MKRQLLIFSISLFLLSSALFAGSGSEKTEKNKKSFQELRLESKNISGVPDIKIFEDGRYLKAAVYSIFIPGAGQAYLGHTWKGAALTLGFFGSGVTAILAQNNFNGREDRIKTLLADYKVTGNYYAADLVWQQIEFEKGNRENDYKRRNLFLILTAGIWVFNMIDVLMFTEAQGEIEFSNISVSPLVSGAEPNGMNGIALTINLF